MTGLTCGVWWSTPLRDDQRAVALLDAVEAGRYERLRRPDVAALFAVGRALAKTVLGHLLGVPPSAIRLDTTCAHCGGSHGKPRLPGSELELSISHAGQRVAVAVTSEAPIGVDIEPLDRSPTALITGALALSERRTLAATMPRDRTTAFLHYWTRKEAILKATGHGLAIEPNEVVVSAPSQPPALLDWAAREPLSAPAQMRAISPGSGYIGYVAVLTSRTLDVVEAHVPDPLEFSEDGDARVEPRLTPGPMDPALLAGRGRL